MSRERRIQTGALLLIAAGIGTGFAWRETHPPPVHDPTFQGGTPAEHALTRVRVRPPERTTIRRVVRLTADIRAYAEASIHARVAGYVGSVSVDVGSRVEAGAELVLLDVPDLDAAVAVAKARQEQATSAVAEAASAHASAEAATTEAASFEREVFSGTRKAEAAKNRSQAELDYRSVVRERLERVRSTSPDLVAQDALDEARSSVDLARADLGLAEVEVERATAAAASARARTATFNKKAEAAQAAVRAAQAAERVSFVAHDLAKTAADFRRIVAPFPGLVVERLIDPGAFVQPGVASRDGPGLVRIVDDSRIRVRFHVAEPDAPSCVIGRTFSLTVDEIPGRTFQGSVARTSEAINDPATRTMLAEGDLDNADAALRHGMFGRMRLDLEDHENVLVLPAEAVTTVKRKSSVLVVEGGKVVKRLIRIGVDDGLRIEVKDGIQEQDLVIVTGGGLVSEGEKVEAVRETGR